MLDKLRNLQYTYKLTLVSMLLVLFNPWLALLVGFIAGCIEWNARESKDVPPWVLWVPGIVMVALWGVMQPMPYDDLNRHVMAWRINFDYRSQYPLAEMPPQDMWLGFDWFMYQLQQWLGVTPQQLAKYWPLGMAIGSYALFLATIRRFAAAHTTSLLLMVISLCFYPVATRAWMGRPEFLYVIMLGAAFFVNKPLAKLAWALGFILLIPSYWMGWPYAAGVLLFNFEEECWKTRARNLALGIGLALLHLGFWQWYTGDYLGIMDWLTRTLQTTLPTESYSLDQSLMTNPGLALFLWIGVVVARFERKDFLRHAPVLLLLAWLSFSNQVRFMAPLMMVAVPWLLQVTPVRKLSGTLKLSALCVTGAILSTGLGFMYVKQPSFAVPANAFVVSNDPFATVLYGAPGVRVEPSPAIGATPKAIAEGLSRGIFDCNKAKAMGVTHVIEHRFTSKPACLSLLEIQGEWRYWEVQ